MGKSSLPLQNTRPLVKGRKQKNVPIVPVRRDSIAFSKLPGFIESYLIKGDMECHSATISNRCYRLGRLVWLGNKQEWTLANPFAVFPTRKAWGRVNPLKGFRCVSSVFLQASSRVVAWLLSKRLPLHRSIAKNKHSRKKGTPTLST